MVSDENGHPRETLRFGRGKRLKAVVWLFIAVFMLNEFRGDMNHAKLAVGVAALGIGLANVTPVRSRFLMPLVFVMLAASVTGLVLLVASWL